MKSISFCGMDISIPKWARDNHRKKRVDKKRLARIKRQSRILSKRFLGHAKRYQWAARGIRSLDDLKAMKEREYAGRQCLVGQDYLDNVIEVCSHITDVYKLVQQNPHQGIVQA